MDDRGMVEILLELERSEDFAEKKANEVDGWIGGYDECQKKKKVELPKVAKLAEQRRDEPAEDSFEDTVLNRRLAKEKYFDHMSKESSKASLYRIKRNVLGSHGAWPRNPLAAVEKEEDPTESANSKAQQQASIFRQSNLRTSFLAQELQKAPFSQRNHHPKHQTPQFSHVTFKAEELIQLAEPKQPLTLHQPLLPARVVQLKPPPLSLVPKLVQEFNQQLSHRDYKKSSELRKNRGASFHSQASGQEKNEQQQDGREPKQEDLLIRTRMFPLSSIELAPMHAPQSNPAGLPRKERSELKYQESISRARDLSVGKKTYSEGFAQVAADYCQPVVQSAKHIASPALPIISASTLESNYETYSFGRLGAKKPALVQPQTEGSSSLKNKRTESVDLSKKQKLQIKRFYQHMKPWSQNLYY